MNIAYGGSCTAGKRSDFDAYHEVLACAAKHDLAVAPGVKSFLQFGTVDVREYCRKKDYCSAFEGEGVELIQRACGACAQSGILRNQQSSGDLRHQPQFRGPVRFGSRARILWRLVP